MTWFVACLRSSVLCLRFYLMCHDSVVDRCGFRWCRKFGRCRSFALSCNTPTGFATCFRSCTLFLNLRLLNDGSGVNYCSFWLELGNFEVERRKF